MDLQGLSVVAYVNRWIYSRVKTLKDFPLSGLAAGETGEIVGYRIDPVKHTENLVCCFPNNPAQIIWSKRDDLSVVWAGVPTDKFKTLGFRTDSEGSLLLPTDKPPTIIGLNLPAAPKESTKKVIPDWPATCHKCGKPAIQLFTSFECSNQWCILHRDFR